MVEKCVPTEHQMNTPARRIDKSQVWYNHIFGINKFNKMRPAVIQSPWFITLPPKCSLAVNSPVIPFTKKLSEQDDKNTNETENWDKGFSTCYDNITQILCSDQAAISSARRINTKASFVSELIINFPMRIVLKSHWIHFWNVTIISRSDHEWRKLRQCYLRSNYSSTLFDKQC